jgi:hypothetical protein
MTDETLQEPVPARRYGINDVLIDAAGLGGSAAITYGAALIYHPAGFIVGGVLTLAAAWLLARQQAAD